MRHFDEAVDHCWYWCDCYVTTNEQRHQEEDEEEVDGVVVRSFFFFIIVIVYVYVCLLCISNNIMINTFVNNCCNRAKGEEGDGKILRVERGAMCDEEVRALECTQHV